MIFRQFPAEKPGWPDKPRNDNVRIVRELITRTHSIYEFQILMVRSFRLNVSGINDWITWKEHDEIEFFVLFLDLADIFQELADILLEDVDQEVLSGMGT